MSDIVHLVFIALVDQELFLSGLIERPGVLPPDLVRLKNSSANTEWPTMEFYLEHVPALALIDAFGWSHDVAQHQLHVMFLALGRDQVAALDHSFLWAIRVFFEAIYIFLQP